MPLPGETYAEARSSIQEPLAPYLARRPPGTRDTAISETRRFLTFVVGVFGCVCISTGFVYNLFSGDLQRKYALSQSDMSTITTISGAAGLLTFPLSLLYDYCGPRPLFIAGLVCLPGGALLFGLTFADVLSGSVARFVAYNTLLGVGTGAFDIAVLMTVLSLFPSSRGAVIGIMKTFIGLGAAVYGSVQIGFFDHAPAHFFFCIAAFTCAVGAVCLAVVGLPPFHLTARDKATLPETEQRRRLDTRWVYYEQVPPLRRFLVGLAVVVALLALLPVQSVYVAVAAPSAACRAALACVTLAVVASVALMAAPSPWLDGGSDAIHGRLREAERAVPEGGATGLERESLLLLARVSTRGSIAEEAVFRMPLVPDDTQYIAPQYDTSFAESLRTPEIWALCFSLFCIIGTQGVVVVNARFIYGAIAGDLPGSEVTAMLTVLNGVGSAVGRMLMSVLEIATQQRPPEQRIPLTAALFLPSGLALLTALLLLAAPPALLWLPFVVAALANGCTAAAVVLVLRTLYARDVALHYNIGALPHVTALVVCNKLLYGRFYSRAAAAQGSLICRGRHCVAVPFAAMAALCAASLLSDAFLHARYSRFCARVLEERRAAHGHPPEQPPSQPPAVIEVPPAAEAEGEEEGSADDDAQPLLS